MIKNRAYDNSFKILAENKIYGLLRKIAPFYLYVCHESRKNPSFMETPAN